MKPSSWLGYAVGVGILGAAFVVFVLGLSHYTEQTTRARMRVAESALADFRELLGARIGSISTVVRNGLEPCLALPDDKVDGCIEQWLAAAPGVELDQPSPAAGSSPEHAPPPPGAGPARAAHRAAARAATAAAAADAGPRDPRRPPATIDIQIAPGAATLLVTVVPSVDGSGAPRGRRYALRIDVGYLASLAELAAFSRLIVTDEQSRTWFVARSDPWEQLPNQVALPAADAKTEDVDIRGRAYRVLVDTIDLGTPIHWQAGPQPISSLKIIGYSLRQRADEDLIPPAQLRYGILLLISLVCALPTIKLFVIGRGERLSRLDVGRMLFSLAVGMTVLTIAATEHQLHRAFHDRLEDDADAVRAKATDGLVGLLHHAKLLIEHARGALCRPPSPQTSCITLPPGVAADRPYVLVRFDGAGAIEQRWSSSPDGARNQICTELVPPAGRYADRDYFRRAKAGLLWGVGSDQIATEVIRSRVSGRAEIITALPLDCAGEERRVVAVTTPPAANDRILPPGIQFAVVDESGRILIHSSVRRSMLGSLPEDVLRAASQDTQDEHEDEHEAPPEAAAAGVIDEASSAGDPGAALADRSRGSASRSGASDASACERSSCARTPWPTATLDGRRFAVRSGALATNAVAWRRLPWRVVMLIDEEPVEQLRIRALGATARHVATYAAGLILVLLAVRLAFGDLGMWPRVAQAPLYWLVGAAAIGLAAAIAAFVPVARIEPMPFRFGIAGGVLVAAVGQLLARTRAGAPRTTSRVQHHWRAAYATAAAGGILLLLVLPATLITQIEFRAQTLDWVARAQRQVGESVRTTLGLSGPATPFGWSASETRMLGAARSKMASAGDQAALGSLDEFLVPTPSLLTDPDLRAHLTEAASRDAAQESHGLPSPESRRIVDAAGRTTARAYLERWEQTGDQLFVLAAYAWPTEVVRDYRAVACRTAGVAFCAVLVLLQLGVLRLWGSGLMAAAGNPHDANTIAVYRHRSRRMCRGARAVLDVSDPAIAAPESTERLIRLGRVRIDSLESALARHETRESARACLERLVQGDVDVLVTARGDLLARCVEVVQGDGRPPDGAAPITEAIRRWESLLLRFERHAVTRRGSTGARTQESFWTVWSRLCDGERLTMIQVAHEGIINPRRARSAQRLIARGLMTFDGMLAVAGMDREQVLHAERPATVAAWEKSDATAITIAIQVAGLAAIAATLTIVNRAYPGTQTLLTTGVASIVAVAGPALQLIRTLGWPVAQAAAPDRTGVARA